MNGFFNTIELHGIELIKANKDCKKQNDRIKLIFEHYGKLTPFQTWEIYTTIWPEAPITSIRRGITTLTKNGVLEKTEKKRVEKYGKVNYFWRIKGLQLKMFV